MYCVVPLLLLVVALVLMVIEVVVLWPCISLFRLSRLSSLVIVVVVARFIFRVTDESIRIRIFLSSLSATGDIHLSLSAPSCFQVMAVDLSSNNKLVMVSVATAVVVVVFTVMFLPKASAFITTPARGGRDGWLRKTFRFATATTEGDGMPVLPKDVVKYSQVPREGKFTADKIPKGLLKEHNTKKGTWGIIRVDKGRLEYKIYGSPDNHVFELSVDRHGIIEPTIRHQVRALSPDLEFVVEFFRLPGTGPVDEKREGL